MELRKHLSVKVIFITIYFVSFLAYLLIGFMPAGAESGDTTLSIPSINLEAEVKSLQLQDNHLDTPDRIVGSFSNHDNKTLLIGHSSTVFGDLNQVKLKDEIKYDNIKYHVVSYEILPKNKISMSEILKSEQIDTIIIMTCAGQNLGGGDSTHRLIIKAIANVL